MIQWRPYHKGDPNVFENVFEGGTNIGRDGRTGHHVGSVGDDCIGISMHAIGIATRRGDGGRYSYGCGSRDGSRR